MADPDPHETARFLDVLAEHTGERILWCRGWTADAAITQNPAIYTIERAPHHVLFPKCSVIVHHGGAGTTQTALLAGTPQVVVSFAVDQSYFGQRTQRVGIGGPPLKRQRLRARALVKSVLAAKQCHAEAARLAESARAHEGITETVALIEGTAAPTLVRGSDASSIQPAS